ncbi:SNF2 family N-terminal domain-containing protein [Lineolata rhizophorae]|uniref:1-phosphatidylinositol 4-kinase n=1 Tax=Lineolata rhizophorae TaxID=578093 RepID=A0A6A6NYC3_9PEZI|nr:SNF2 family N-terminal domain-containing protein [Lineolata rhizophorae]
MPRRPPASSGYARIAQAEEEDDDILEDSDEDDPYVAQPSISGGGRYAPIQPKRQGSRMYAGTPAESAATSPSSRRALRRPRSNSGVDIKAINARLERWADEIASKLKIRSKKGKPQDEEPLEIHHSVFQAPDWIRPATAETLATDYGAETSGDRMTKLQFDDVIESVRLAIEQGVHPKLISQGSSGSYFARNTEGKVVGVFKPKDEEPYASKNPKWTKWIHRNLFPFFFGRACLIPNLSYVSEAAAYVLDAQLRTNLVPYTDIVSLSSKSFFYDFWDRRAFYRKKKPLPEKIGSFQIFLKGFKDANVFLKEHPWPDQHNSNLYTTHPKKKKRRWTDNCRPSGNVSDDEEEESSDFRSDNAEEAHRRSVFWTEHLQQSFREELEKLVILDYIMRNTDRGLDNWMIRIDRETQEASIVAEPPRSNGDASRASTSTPDPYKRQETMVAASRSATPMAPEEHPSARVKIGAIDNSLSWPWKHPDAWRSFPFGWLFLPVSLIGQPFSQRTKEHFLPLLTSKKWWADTQAALRRCFVQDADFQEKMYARQIAVMKGQAWNVVETLKTPDHGPLELTRRARVCVWDDLVDIPVAVPLRVPSQEMRRRQAALERHRSFPEQEEMDISAALASDPQPHHDLLGLNTPPTELANSNSNRFNMSRQSSSLDVHRDTEESTAGPLSPTSVQAITCNGFLIADDDAEGDLGYAAAEDMEGMRKRVIVERLENVKSKKPFFTWSKMSEKCLGVEGIPSRAGSAKAAGIAQATPTRDRFTDQLHLMPASMRTNASRSLPIHFTSLARSHRLPLSNLTKPIARGSSRSPQAGDKAAGQPPIASSSNAPSMPQGPSAKSKRAREGDGTELGGMGSMIERMHPLAERVFAPNPPNKRAKLDNLRASTPGSRSNFGSGGGSLTPFGPPGQEMQQTQGTMGDASGAAHAAAASSSAGIVDLTADEDDCVVVGDNGDTEVLVGRLESTFIQTHRVPYPRPRGPQGTHKQWPHIMVAFRRIPNPKNILVSVLDGMGKDVGYLDNRTAELLVRWLDCDPKYRIRLQGRIESRPRKEAAGGFISEVIPVTLNIYTARRNIDRIGNYLRQRQRLLQIPLFCDRGIDVVNPHYQNPAPSAPPGTGVPSSSLYGRISAEQTREVFSRTVEQTKFDVVNKFDELVNKEIIEEKEPPPSVKTPLLKHQKQALRFFTNMEAPPNPGTNEMLWERRVTTHGLQFYYHVITGESRTAPPPPRPRGGLFADVMGLGKSLSILARILDTLEEARSWESRTQNQSDSLPRTRATLLVAPLSTVATWEDQIAEHINGGQLSYVILHGQFRNRLSIAGKDLVITTYSVLSQEFGRQQPSNTALALFKTHWFRVVLDEAHEIRNQASRRSMACNAISSEYRWAMTGTPVQNRLDDLGALLTFLKFYPFDRKSIFSEHILRPFKNADPNIIFKLRLLVGSITLRRQKDRIDLPTRHEELVRLNFTEQEKALYDFFAADSQRRVQTITNPSNNLRGKIWSHILKTITRLRRICAHGEDLLMDEDLSMLNGLSYDDPIDLGDEDDDTPAVTVGQALDELRLRVAGAESADEAGYKEDEPEKETEPARGKDFFGFMLHCYECICSDCTSWFEEEKRKRASPDNYMDCPICSQYVRMAPLELHSSELAAEELRRQRILEDTKLQDRFSRYKGPHTKTRALINYLDQNVRESETLAPGEPPIKSVIFSEWTSHLDLVAIALESQGHQYVRLDGKMHRGARAAAVNKFRDDPDVRVFLVTTKAGGQGLNLTVACRAYVMEPQYNPAMESQAVERVHRLGQRREVRITRFIMAGSFEEKMLELQSKKRELAALSMEKGKKTADEENVARLQYLRTLFK